MKRTKQKLDTILEVEGFESLEKLFEESEFGLRAGVPSICMNEGCDYVIDMEPDQDRGWCDVCKTNSVKSAYILAGII